MGEYDDIEVDILEAQRATSPKRITNQGNPNEERKIFHTRDIYSRLSNALWPQDNQHNMISSVEKRNSEGSDNRERNLSRNLTFETLKEFESCISPRVVNPNSSRRFLLQDQQRAGSEPPRTTPQCVTPESSKRVVVDSIHSYNDAADEFRLHKKFEYVENYTNLGCCSLPRCSGMPEAHTPLSPLVSNPENVDSQHITASYEGSRDSSSPNAVNEGKVDRAQCNRETLLGIITNLEKALQREKEWRRMTENKMSRNEYRETIQPCTVTRAMGVNPMGEAPKLGSFLSVPSTGAIDIHTGTLPSRKWKQKTGFAIDLAVLEDSVSPPSSDKIIKEICNPNSKARSHSRCFSSPPKETRHQKLVYPDIVTKTKAGPLSTFQTPPLLMEFFYLTAISVKLKLAKNLEVEPTVGTPTEVLWNQVQKLKLPFTDFYDFLMDSLVGVYLHVSNRKYPEHKSSKFLGALKTLGVLQL